MAPSTSVARPVVRAGVALALITDVATVAYGLWTIVSTLTVVTGGSTRTGLTPGAVACLALIAAGALLVRAKPAWRAAYVRDAEARPLEQPLAVSRGARLAWLIGVPLAIALWLATRSLVAVWGVALAGYAWAAAAGLGQRGEPAEPEAEAPAALEARRMWIVHALALACAAFTLLSIRPRTDDPFYLSISVSVVDYPDAPLLAARTLHGPPTETLAYQPMFPPYKVHSFETLGGYIAYLTGLDVSAVVHFGLATLFGGLVPYVLARLFRWLVPRAWLLALVATLSYLVIDGSAGRGYANQAFVRMFNGKAVMLAVFVPLIVLYGLRFGARPGGLAFALLALAQLSAMGASSTGIWLAPLLGVLAVAAGTPRPARLLKTVPLAVASAAYVLAMGAWIFTLMPTDRGAAAAAASAAAAVEGVEGSEAPPRLEQSAPEVASAMLAPAISDALGGERAAIGLLAAFSIACFIARRAPAFRLLAYCGLTLTAVLVNPWLTDLVGRLITGTITYERVFWVLPVPIAVGLGAAHAKEWLTGRLTSREATLATCACVIAFYAASVERLVISDANRAWLRFPPALKVWPTSRKVAEVLCRIVPEGEIILAPEMVSQQLVTITGCGAPVIAGMRWMQTTREDRESRLELQRYVTVVGDVPQEKLAAVRTALGRYRVAAVAMTPQALKNREMKALLHVKGYKKIAIVEKHHVWYRKLKAWPAPQAQKPSGS